MHVPLPSDPATSHFEQSTDPARVAHVVVVGSGGNIGSQLVPLLARMPEVARITLIDPDVYEAKNLRSQRIRPSDVGRRKVRVQAAMVRSLRPDIHCDPLPMSVEDVPLGRLRGDLILAGLDSRAARQAVNQSAWRLGIPWIDAGVSGADRLARVNVFLPDAGQPCLECAWSDDDYRALETRHPCQKEASNAPTQAPAWLGALAAALAAAECEKFLKDRRSLALIGRQVLIDAQHHVQFVTAFRRNPRCRFDHRGWKIDSLPDAENELRLGDLAALAGAGEAALSCEGRHFVHQPPCPRGCDGASPTAPAAQRRIVGLSRRTATLRCPNCGETLIPRGWDLTESIALGTQNATTLRRRLSTFGLRPHDILTLTTPADQRHFELSASRSRLVRGANAGGALSRP